MGTRAPVVPLALGALLLLFPTSCSTNGDETRDYRADMRTFVERISTYARGKHPGFLIIPQNGHDLVTLDGTPDGTPAAEYLAAVDGLGREDLFYGYTEDDSATPADVTAVILPFLRTAHGAGKSILVTDYCWTPGHVTDSYSKNHAENFLSFAAPDRSLNTIPSGDPYGKNVDPIAALSQAANFLYLLDPSGYSTRTALVADLDRTLYDLFIIDSFFQSDDPLMPADVAALQSKPAGDARRLAVAYMSIGEAESYRYYWKSSWNTNPPAWLAAENPAWPGNYKVKYWDPAWQAIIFGSPDAYLDRILDAGFDGAYLDIIDAFEYFEGQE